MARYLVTGGAGFIGSHLVEELLRRGEQVRVADNFSTGRRDNLEAAAAAAGADVPPVVEGDLADAAVAAAAVAGVDYVLHQAAIPSVPRSVNDPIASNRANVDATLHLLVAARDAGVRRVVFAGSSSVYGDAAELPKHEAMPHAAAVALRAAEGRPASSTSSSSPRSTVSTPSRRATSTSSGRARIPSSPYSGVISLFIRAVLDGTTPIIYGDGGQTRDFTYVANTVDGVLRAAVAPGVAGEVINVATSGRISLNELLAEVQRLAGTQLDAQLPAGPRRRHPRLAGRHRQGRPAARLRADRAVRRGPAADGRVGREPAAAGDARLITARRAATARRCRPRPAACRIARPARRAGRAPPRSPRR